MKTSGIQYDDLATNLVAAFPSREALLEVFRFALDQPLDALDTGTDLRELAGRLIEASEAQPNGTARLIAAARDARPDDPALAQVAQHVGLAPAPPAAAEKGGLENANDPMSGLMSPSELVSHITRLQTQVCLIELRGGAWGTGFLVGPNLVLTNYHVAESLINQRARPSDFTLLFDYKQDSTGAIVHGGVRYALADPDWRVDFSPYHPDEVKGSAAVDPDETQLDYALLRTAGTPGYDPIGGKLGPPRGWLVLRSEEYPFPEGDVLHIFQHPRGLPIQTAYGTVIGVNANRTRVTYRPTTHPGSSGSPVLNRDWQLVALHHHGSSTHNQGIPVSTIRGLLTKRGHSALLDIPLPTWSTPPGPAPSILPQPVPTNQPEPPAAPDDASEAEWSPTALAELHEALLSAFDRGGLQQLLYLKLGTDYAQITPASANYRDEVLAIVQWAKSQVRIEDLVREGRTKNPGNPKLKAWEARYLPPR